MIFGPGTPVRRGHHTKDQETLLLDLRRVPLELGNNQVQRRFRSEELLIHQFVFHSFDLSHQVDVPGRASVAPWSSCPSGGCFLGSRQWSVVRRDRRQR